jgi:hypothetical protein
VGRQKTGEITGKIPHFLGYQTIAIAYKVRLFSRRLAVVVNRNGSQKRWHINGVYLGCIVLTIIFGTAAVAKIQGFNNFESTIVASLLVPIGWTPFVATLIVTLEVLLTLGLFVPAFRKSSLQIMAVMVSMFIGYALWRGLQQIPIPCHCFGTLFTLTPMQSLMLNVSILLLVTFLLINEEKNITHKVALINSVTMDLET